MNSFDDMIIDKKELNDIGSLNQRIERIEDMDNWISYLDDEIHSCRRRLWMNYENMVDLAWGRT